MTSSAPRENAIPGLYDIMGLLVRSGQYVLSWRPLARNTVSFRSENALAPHFRYAPLLVASPSRSSLMQMYKMSAIVLRRDGC